MSPGTAPAPDDLTRLGEAVKVPPPSSQRDCLSRWGPDSVIGVRLLEAAAAARGGVAAHLG